MNDYFYSDITAAPNLIKEGDRLRIMDDGVSMEGDVVKQDNHLLLNIGGPTFILCEGDDYHWLEDFDRVEMRFRADERDVVTDPFALAHLRGERVRIYYTPKTGLDPIDGWVVYDSGVGWCLRMSSPLPKDPATEEMDGERRIFTYPLDPGSGFYPGIARVVRLPQSQEVTEFRQERERKEQEEFIAEQKIEERVTLARTTGQQEGGTEQQREVQRQIKEWWLANVDNLDESTAATVASLIEDTGFEVPEPKDREITVNVAFKFTARAVDFEVDRELEVDMDRTIIDSTMGLDMVELDSGRFIADPWQPPQYEITEITVEDE